MGTEVVFFDYSKFGPASPVTAWRWDFGDGKFSNEKGGPWAPVTHTYNNPGTYYVILTVTNQCGCSTSDTLQIDVDPSPGVEIFCPGVVCENDTIIYHVNASCPGGSWQVVGGTILLQSSSSINIVWDNIDPVTGFGYIIYDPAGSCPGLCPAPVAKKIPVVKATANIQGPDNICVNRQYLYTLPQWPTTRYVWSVNNANVTLQPTDQPNEAVLLPTPAASGTVTLTCNYTNTLLGCSGAASKVITIPGSVSITDTVFEFCQGVETVFHIAGPNASTGQWTILKPDNTTVTGSGDNFPIMLDQIGTYLLSVKGSFCPIEPKEVKIVGNPDAPESITGPDRICRGIPTPYSAGIIDNDHFFTWSISNGTLNIPVGEVTDVTLNPAANYPFTLSVQRVTKDKPHCVSAPTEKTIQAPFVIFFVNGEDTVCPSQKYDYYTSSVDVDEYYWNIYPQGMGSVDSGQGSNIVKVLWNKQPGIANLVCRVKNAMFIITTL
jgi:PKD repeat protein